MNFFRKNRHSDQLEKHIQAIVDPTVPLELQSYNQHNKGGRPKSLTDANIIQIMCWKADNISNREIARQLHVSEMTIRRYIKSCQSSQP
jgi:response regulator of citrate/malate metabolism